MEYKFHNLLFSVDSKLFARCKWEGHCIHHMLSPRQSSSQMILRSRGHSFWCPSWDIWNDKAILLNSLSVSVPREIGSAWLRKDVQLMHKLTNHFCFSAIFYICGY